MTGAPRAGAGQGKRQGRLLGAAALVVCLACQATPVPTERPLPSWSLPVPSASPTSSATPDPTPSPSPAPTATPATGAPTASPGPSGTPASSPSQSPGPSPSPVEGTFLEVVRDDLSSAQSGFPTVDDETQRVTYDEGTLRLDLKLPGRATWSARQIGDWPLADVDATFLGVDESGTGFYGLTCGLDGQHFYAGVAGSDGSVLLLRVDDGTATRLAHQLSAFTPPAAGGSIALALSCAGTDSGGAAGVALSIGGRVVAAATDSVGVAGLRTAGLYAESAIASERFSVRADDFLVTVGLRIGPPVGPSPTPSLTGDPVADALAAHVPEALRATCRKVERLDFDETVAIDCPSLTVASAVYLEYATTELMTADFQELVSAHPEATAATCSVGPGEGPYRVDGVEVGRLLCFERFEAVWFAWTDTRLDVMGIARRADGSFPAMYDWWLQAGPTL